MKRKFLYIPIVLVAIAFQGCSKSFLEVSPATNLSSTTFYTNETNAFEAVTAVYSCNAVQNWAITPMMSDIWSDDEYKGGSAFSDMAAWGTIENQDMSASDINSVFALWQRLYIGIYRANTYLDNQGTVVWTNPANQTRFEAEVRFLRANFYWDLERHYGWVPLVLTANPNVTYYQSNSQSTPTQVYTQIAKDLLFAVHNLPSKALPASEMGRATKYAAQALLARIFMFYNGYALKQSGLGITSDWTDGTTDINSAFVEATLDTIISQPQYSLLPTYSNLFDWKHQNSSEGIFEIQYSALGKSSDWTTYFNIDGNFMDVFTGPRSPNPSTVVAAGWSFGVPTWSLVNEFEAGDPRYAATIFDASKGLTSYTYGFQNTGYFNNKYMGLTAYVSSLGDSRMNYAENFIDMRLADVLLMAAELHLTDNPSLASTYFNMVRMRSMGAAGKITTPITLANIQHERRVEFACEGLRKWDLMRWGTQADPLSYAETEINATFAEANFPATIPNPGDFIMNLTVNPATWGMWPIPQYEIDQANPGVMKQYIPLYQSK